MGSSSKGGEEGPSPGQTEAYENFSGYGQQYGGDIGSVPGYDAWSTDNPELIDAANMGFSEGAAAKSSQDAYSNMFASMEHSSNVSAKQQRLSGVARSLMNKDATFNEVVSATGTEDLQSAGDSVGYVWDENTEQDFHSKYFSNITGGWRGVNQEEFNEISSMGRSGVLSSYGGLYSAEGENVYERYQGENTRDEAYAGYLEAGKVAGETIDSQIARERSQATLIGVDYDVTDEQRTSRVNSEFSNVWSSEQDTAFRELMGDFGDPEDFGGYTYERGAVIESDPGT